MEKLSREMLYAFLVARLARLSESTVLRGAAKYKLDCRYYLLNFTELRFKIGRSTFRIDVFSAPSSIAKLMVMPLIQQSTLTHLQFARE
ncbi:hypothetical protein [Nonomuraea salmonea]|uniref:hypothetical protein n=1 Tax=Nonomuraea salmonea TaxID=46181 RepID=UPI002FEC535C